MSAPAAGVPPATILMQLINGKSLSRCVSLAAELAIADLLADGPKDVQALAQATATSPDPLYRVLRLLAGAGVFEELPDRRFQGPWISAF